ncbi:MAG TPA: GAF domain-containing protein [Thermoflexia bacterium]|nr:GAF domain-containing protein [Thermoflexia bacterium]
MANDGERVARAKTVPSQQQAVPAGLWVWRQDLVRGILRVLVVLGGLAMLGGSQEAYLEQMYWLIPVYVGAYTLLLLVTFWPKVPYAMQVWILLLLVYGLGILGLYESGLSGDGRVFLLILPFLAAVFLGRQAGTGALIFVLLNLVAFGWAFSTGKLYLSPEVQANTADATAWMSGTIVFGMLGALLVISLNYLLPRLASSLQQSRHLTWELEIRSKQLEQWVAERTADLERRSMLLETAAQVAREAAAIHDVRHLLAVSVDLISAKFGFYHAGLFLVDPLGEYAELRAASSPGGQRMLARGHRLRVGQTGVVGYAAEQGELRIARDVGKDTSYFDNPDLPQTRSEVALPLRTRERVIGVLDVQSTQLDAFSEEDVQVLRTLADQLALVVANAQLYQQVEERLAAERRSYGELSHAEWRAWMQGQRAVGFIRNQQGLSPTDNLWRARMAAAVRQGAPVVDSEDKSALALPIRVHDHLIGVIDVRKPKGAGSWSETELVVLTRLGEQLGVALDSARLHQETRQRAEREKLIGDIITRVRASTAVAQVLQSTAREIGRAMGAESWIWLDVEEEDHGG